MLESYKLKTINYKAFKAAFTHFSIELKKPKEDWKDEFEHRLTLSLQKALAVYFLNKDINYTKIA